MERPKYVLLDRDGVINEAVRAGYVSSPAMVRLLPGAARAIAMLHRGGFRIVVVSNQQCVGKGIVTPRELDAITASVRAAIEAGGGAIADFLYCTHLEEDACVCRKPRPGLLIEAQRRYGFDLAGTYFVGDSYTDLEAARRAGCRAMFVLTGLDARRYRAGEPLPDPAARVVPDLVAAAESLLAGQ